MSSSFMRRIAILDILESSGSALSVSDIINKLESYHFTDDSSEAAITRTVQRDLKFLFDETGLGIEQIPEGNQNLWHKPGQSSGVNKKSKLTPTSAAFALELTKKHLNRLLPEQSKKDLEPYFRDSEKALAKQQEITQKSLKRTSDRIEYAQRGFALVPDDSVQNFSKDTLERIYEAIATRKRVTFNYNGKRNDSEGKPYDVSPIAIMIKEPKSYLLAIKESRHQPGKPIEEQVQQFVLNRISDIYINNRSSRDADSFDYKQYLKDGHADPCRDNDRKLYNAKIRLRVTEAHAPLIRDLKEYKLHQQQTISEEKSTGFFILKAPVRRSHSFYEWIMGRGADIEVLQPKIIRDDITQLVKELHKIYH